MAFLVLDDGRTTIDGVLFPDKYKQYETMSQQQNDILVVHGKFEERNQRDKLSFKVWIQLTTLKITNYLKPNK